MELLFHSLIRRNLLIAITLLIRAELTVAEIRRTRQRANTRATKSKDSRHRVRQQIYFLAARMERAD